jgi:hypothetical protein
METVQLSTSSRTIAEIDVRAPADPGLDFYCHCLLGRCRARPPTISAAAAQVGVAKARVEGIDRRGASMERRTIDCGCLVLVLEDGGGRWERGGN